MSWLILGESGDGWLISGEDGGGIEVGSIKKINFAYTITLDTSYKKCTLRSNFV